MAKPKQFNERLTILIDGETKKEFFDVCEHQGWVTSDVLRTMIDEFIEDNPPGGRDWMPGSLDH